MADRVKVEAVHDTPGCLAAATLPHKPWLDEQSFTVDADLPNAIATAAFGQCGCVMNTCELSI